MKLCLDCGKPKSRKGNYCKKCGYKHRIRPKGLSYKIIVVNKGWIKKGQVLNGKSPSKKTREIWSIQRKGKHNSVVTEFKKGQTLGKLNTNWKGNAVGYYALHLWIRRKLGKPVECENCNSNENVEWANKSHEYKRDVKDWISLCHKCNMKYDSKTGWGEASKKFNL